MYQGTGIGLSPVKELVELMGGTITDDSVKFQGTTFTVRFPAFRREADLPEQWLVIPPQAAERIEDHKAESKRRSDVHPIVDAQTKSEDAPLILVVEDHNEVRHFVKGLLDKDFEVITARNGQEGLQIAIEQVPDVIVSDVNMPEMDGFEMARLLREEDVVNHIPVIFLTARDEDVDRMQGWEEGAQAYLTKPFNEDELLQVCHNMLEQRDRMYAYFKRVVEIQKKKDEKKSLTKSESFCFGSNRWSTNMSTAAISA